MAALPVPRSVTSRVTASPGAAASGATRAPSVNEPTAPENDGGAPGGSGRTSMAAAGAVTRRSTRRLRKGEKKASKASRGSASRASISYSIGARSRVPARAGNSARRRMVTACMGRPPSVAGRGYVEAVGTSISSRQNPVASHVPTATACRGETASGSK